MIKETNFWESEKCVYVVAESRKTADLTGQVIAKIKYADFEGVYTHKKKSIKLKR